MAIVGGEKNYACSQCRQSTYETHYLQIRKTAEHMPVSGKRKCLAPKPNDNSHYTIVLFEHAVLTQDMHFGKTTHLSLFENKVKRNLDFFQYEELS